ncbi:hypothetical protein ZOSMA_18G01140 [Zostera marina]|uniref:BHLH domain-containing protein n=1 Tax=Zostera marina TaxID=29655 RepID=A0A0K9PPW8_ZOSMR|nr:hypothetical protein ZOSMA_18G01140 [Zostera marina]
MYSDVYGRLGSTSAAGGGGFMAAALSAATSTIAVDRAGIASRNHREAEKRRRERIKSHLDRLRHLLSCDPKIDKATLLAKAVAHVRDLKQQTSQIPDVDRFPTEIDSITISTTADRSNILKVTLCCDDRPRLFPDLIDTLKSLRLRTVRAELATVCGRVRCVFLVAKETEDEEEEEEEVLREALKAVVEKDVTGAGGSSVGCDRMKRRRVVERDDDDD